MPERKLNFINDDAFHLVFTGDSVSKRWPELWRCFAKRGDRAVWWPSFLSDDFMSRFSFVAGLVGFPSIIGLFALRFRIGRLRAMIGGLQATVIERENELRTAQDALAQAQLALERERPASLQATIERERAANRLDHASRAAWGFIETRAEPLALIFATHAEYLVSLSPGAPGMSNYEVAVLAGIASILDPARYPFSWMPEDLHRVDLDKRLDLTADIAKVYLPSREDAARTFDELMRVMHGPLLEGRYFSIIVPIARRAVAIAVAYPNLGMEREWDARFNLAQSVGASGSLEEAIVQCEVAEQSLADQIRPSSELMLRWRRLHLNLLQQRGEWDRATPILQDVLAIAEASLGPHHEITVTTAISIIMSLVKSDPESALSMSAKLLERLRDVYAPAHRHVIELRNLHAEALEAVGRTNDAVLVYVQNSALAETRYGSAHPDTRRLKRKLKRIDAG